MSIAVTDSRTVDHARGKAAAGVAGFEREPVGDRVAIYRTPKSPNWYLDYCVDGKQVRRSLKTTSRKRARELAVKRDAELALGVAAAPAKRAATIDEARRKLLTQLKERERDHETLLIYSRCLWQLQSFAADRGETRLSALTADLLEEFQRALGTSGFMPREPDPMEWKPAESASQQQPRRKVRPGNKRRKTGDRKAAPATVFAKMKIVRQLIRFAVKRGMVTIDPAPGYYLPPRPRRQAHCWSPQELRAILDAADPTVLDLLNFLRLTGLRSNELCWLTKDDLDVGEHPHVKVRAKICPQTGKRWRPKHGNERIVPRGEAALAIATKASAASPGPWLFHASGTCGRQVGHWRPARVWRLLKRAMKAAGVKRGSVHTCRHVFTSFLANLPDKQVSPFQVMKVLGHGSLDIVLTYFHSSEEELCAAIGGVRFEQMLPAQEPKDHTQE